MSIVYSVNERLVFTLRGRNRNTEGKMFTNPTFVRYLITSFVQEDWVKGIDFTKMEKLDKEFIDQECRRSESDIIYKVSFHDLEAYIFLLIEFQSTVDQFMALRVLHYISKFYLDLLEHKKYHLLPPVFPVVLYNGEKEWTAPVEFKELIEVLLRLNNLVSALFYIENSAAGEIEKAIHEIIDIGADPALNSDEG